MLKNTKIMETMEYTGNGIYFGFPLENSHCEEWVTESKAIDTCPNRYALSKATAIRINDNWGESTIVEYPKELAIIGAANQTCWVVKGETFTKEEEGMISCLLHGMGGYNYIPELEGMTEKVILFLVSVKAEICCWVETFTKDGKAAKVAAMLKGRLPFRITELLKERRDTESTVFSG